MSKKRKSVTVPNGGTFQVKSGIEFSLGCCDCELTHKTIATIISNEYIQIKVTRDTRATAQRRRRAASK